MPAEETIEQTSAARYRSLVLATGQIVWTNSPSGEMLGEQPGWGEFTGQKFDEYQRFGWADAVHPDDRQPTIDAWSEAVRRKGIFAFEHRVKRSDGVYRHFMIRAVPVLNEDRSIREWVGVHTDITEHREAQEALAESEQRYRLLAEMAPILVWTAKIDGGFDYLSPAFATFSDKSITQIAKEGWLTLAHPADLPKIKEEWRNALSQQNAFEVEARLLRGSDQRYRWHRLRAVPVRDAHGSVIKWIGSGVDIDDQRRMAEVQEAALAQVKAERERLQRVITSSPNVVAVYQGKDHRIELVNPMWERFVGKKNAVGRTVRELFPEVEGQGVFEILDEVYATGRPYSNEKIKVLFDRKGNGTLEETWWCLNFQPLTSSDGTTTGIVAHGTDITAMVRAQEALEAHGIKV